MQRSIGKQAEGGHIAFDLATENKKAGYLVVLDLFGNIKQVYPHTSSTSYDAVKPWDSTTLLLGENQRDDGDHQPALHS